MSELGAPCGTIRRRPSSRRATRSRVTGNCPVIAGFRFSWVLVSVGEHSRVCGTFDEVRGSDQRCFGKESAPWMNDFVLVMRCRPASSWIARPRMPTRSTSFFAQQPGEVASAGPTADPRIYTFVTGTAGPIIVTTHLEEKFHGGELATASKTVEVRPERRASSPSARPSRTRRPARWCGVRARVSAPFDREIDPGYADALRGS